MPRHSDAGWSRPGGDRLDAGDEPYRRLWLAVIKHALRDLTTASRTTRREAREFLLEDEGGLDVIARLARLSPRRVRRQAIRALEAMGPEDLPAEEGIHPSGPSPGAAAYRNESRPR